MNRTIIVAATFLVALGTRQAAGANALYFASSPTSWVGHGQTHTFTSADGYSFTSQRMGSLGDRTNDLQFIIRQTSTLDRWELDFVGPDRILVEVGSYLDAQRYPFNEAGHPGLVFEGDGRGDNRLTGWFNVLEVTFDSGGQIQRFAADFTQYDEEDMARWNFGSFRYNSDIPLTTIPEPSTIVLAITAFATLPLRCRK